MRSALPEQPGAGLAEQARPLASLQQLELAPDVCDGAEPDDGPGGERRIEVRGALAPAPVALDLSLDQALEAPVERRERLADQRVVALGQAREDDAIQAVLAVVLGLVGEQPLGRAPAPAARARQLLPDGLGLREDLVERSEEHRALVGPEAVERLLLHAAALGQRGGRRAPVAELGEGACQGGGELAAALGAAVGAGHGRYDSRRCQYRVAGTWESRGGF